MTARPTPPSVRRAAAVCLGLLSAGCAPSPAAAAPAPASPAAATGGTAVTTLVADTGVIRVSGRASVEVPADRARLRFAMESEAESAAEAADANAARMTRVLDAVRAAVGDAGAVETSGYGLTPIYSRPQPGGSRTISGYRVLNHVDVTLTDVDRVGAVLDAAVRAGVNRVDQLSFFAHDTRAPRLEAIRRATARAREEAEVLAAALGGRLGEPLEVGVSGAPVAPPFARAAAEMVMADTPVEPGSQEVAVTVNLTFRLDGTGR